MSREHFKAIAEALRESQPGSQTHYYQWESDCMAIANALAKLNPRFDKGKFLEACRN